MGSGGGGMKTTFDKTNLMRELIVRRQTVKEEWLFLNHLLRTYYDKDDKLTSFTNVMNEPKE